MTRSAADEVVGEEGHLRTAEEVEVGRHGLIIERGDRRGVLLPEVPTDHGWDRRAYLEGVCRKARLPPDAWRDARTRLEVFETFKYGGR